MRMFKNIAVLLLTLCMILTSVTVPAFAEGYSIDGDVSVYRAPVGATQKIEYAVVDGEGNAVTDGVVWSVSDYSGVSIDANGVLSVDGSALAGDITVTATKDSLVLAEKTVTILAKPEQYSDLFDRYYEDFEVYKEDDTIFMKDSPYRSSIKYSDPSGTGLVVGKEENGNTYAKATGLCYWGAAGNATLMIEPTKDGGKTYMPDASVVTLDARFMIENEKADYQSLMWFEAAGLRLGYTASAEEGKANIYDYATNSNTVIATVNTDEWFDLRVEFDHTAANYDVYLNNIRIIEGNTLAGNLYIGAGARGNGFYIGASVDNLALYNGRNAKKVENAEITGDSTIYRAPVGTTQKLVYTTEAELTDGTVWSLKDAPAGVTIDQSGVLKVPGSVDAGTFEIQIVNSGLVIGSKSVTIHAQPEKYIKKETSGRYFEDFKRYEDAVITTGTHHGDIKLTSGIVATEEENGNVYAKAYIAEGTSWASSSAAIKLLNSWNDDKVYMPDASNVVFEGDFKAEVPTNGARWPMMWHNAIGINISYEFAEGDNFAKIVYTDDSITPGTGENTNATAIAHVEADKWFNLRVELDYSADKYSVFVDDICVLKDKDFATKGVRLNKDVVIAASIDNIAMYNGTKDASISYEKTEIVENGVVLDEGTKEFKFTEDKNFNLYVTKTMKNTTEKTIQAGLVAAVYNADGSLKTVDIDGVYIRPDRMGSLLVELDCDVKAGESAKIFTWDFKDLTPIE